MFLKVRQFCPIIALLCTGLTPSAAQTGQTGAIEHTLPPPAFLGRMQPFEAVQGANSGFEIERDRGAADVLADHRRLSAVLGGLRPQRPGTVDAYVLSVALDSDPVFGREAREAARVLSRRFDAAGRSIVLAAPDGEQTDALPRGSLTSLSIALARIAEVMDVEEDVLVLFTTSHGTPNGLYYHYGDQGYGGISPSRLSSVLSELGIVNRFYIANACFSGIFVSGLASPASVIVSAASSGRTSFGCAAGNDWTYFGDAFVNNALRRPEPLANAFRFASRTISEWEKEDGLEPSDPQISVGANAAQWLAPLEARMPREATRPVGRPSRETPQ